MTDHNYESEKTMWVIIHLLHGETEQALEDWVSPTDHGARIDWPEAGHSLIPWWNILRIDHQPQISTPTND